MSLEKRSLLAGIALLFSCLTSMPSAVSASEKQPSILFINIDDLNDWNSTLKGHPQAITPNIQRLAAKGMTFTRAICSSPVCFPSRTSLFTGMHPARTGAISNFNWARPWRFYVGDAVTLPKHLEANGWKTFGAGKNFHGGNQPEFQEYFGRPREPKPVKGTSYFKGPVGWGVTDVPYEQMPDHRVVSWGIEQIESTKEPLFLSLGIFKPHVKWVLPQSSFDKYPLDSFEEPAFQKGDLDDLPPRFRQLAHNEAKFGIGFHEQLRKDGQVKKWARAYLASVTFADEQLGRLLDAWEASPHSKDGIVVLWSDHGFMLGEKEGWGKFKPWYDAIHCNLVIAGTGVPQGVKCHKAVSLLDIYPTLVSQLGLKAPTAQELDGNDLSPLLKSPDSEWEVPVVMSHEEDGIRYDVILENQYRMTRLITGETELYDLSNDPHEWTNLASDSRFVSTVKRLEKHLTFNTPTIPEDGWMEAESLPCQTSADYGRRGNFHYRRANEDASGGSYLCAELKKGKDSYIDFVIEIKRPGAYQFNAAFGSVTSPCELAFSIADVSLDAKQATSDFAMTQIGGALKMENTPSFKKYQLGQIDLTTGRKLIRLKLLSSAEAIVRLDQIQLAKMND